MSTALIMPLFRAVDCAAIRILPFKETATVLTGDAQFNEGDLLPRPVLRTPEGSGADVMASAAFKNGRWALVMRRKLVTGNADDNALQEGQVYRVGFAVFDDNVSNRRHHVSFVKNIEPGS
ncbi:MAG: hypothetical protein KGZ79_12515 [Dethiobacter sp.]|nr:hypothetical protein [Dethiobacter sp.]